jgi:hypothetical protein
LGSKNVERKKKLKKKKINVHVAAPYLDHGVTVQLVGEAAGAERRAQPHRSGAS